jgi:hypothetical protein
MMHRIQSPETVVQAEQCKKERLHVCAKLSASTMTCFRRHIFSSRDFGAQLWNEHLARTRLRKKPSDHDKTSRNNKSVGFTFPIAALAFFVTAWHATPS